MLHPKGWSFRKSRKTYFVKKTIVILLLPVWFGSCGTRKKNLVSRLFIDSLITHYSPPVIAGGNREEALFWQRRINPGLPGYLNETHYAACLATTFQLSGEIDSLRKADSLLFAVDRNFNHKEASVQLALVSHSITRHRFHEADSLLQRAKEIGLRPYESHSHSFDVAFELGNYFQARAELNAIQSPNDYGYYFRKSRLDHLDGKLDSAIADMDKAVALAGTNEYLLGVARANAGDLYLHAEAPERARDAYVACVRRNSADFHSLLGLGWIALVYDGNDSLAETIFRFVHGRNPLPDAVFKLEQMAGARRDTLLQSGYARDFVALATRPVYGGMYDKYLIQLNTGVLRNPAAAETLAREELKNRATPQTYAWYAWALFAGQKKEEAYAVFQRQVSGKPLEALELYWMGRLMEGLGKNYNAREFFKAAVNTRYDLDPADATYIRKKLEE
jgi:tetratricopeptide (TPR) repeat protein